MTLSRRQALAVAAGPILLRESSRAAGSDESSRRACLSAWLDTLYPGEGTTPAASLLGIHEQIEQKAETVSNYTELLKRGTAWADSEAAHRGATSFAELNGSDREAIVTVAESMSRSSVPGMFFLHTLRDGALFYYGNQQTWTAFGFPHPPQPSGFPGFAVPPNE